MVVIMVGTIDANNDVSQARFQSNLERWVSQSVDNGISVVLVKTPHRDGYTTSTKADNVQIDKLYHPVIDSIAQTYGAMVIDPNPYLMRPPYTSGYEPTAYNANSSTFANTDIDTATDTITSASHGFLKADSVVFTTTGTLSSDLTAGKIYYIRSMSANTFEVYTDPALTTQVDFTDQGTGTYTATLTIGAYMPIRPTTHNGFYYYSASQCVPSSEPTWPLTVDATVSDGTCTWVNGGSVFSMWQIHDVYGQNGAHQDTHFNSKGYTRLAAIVAAALKGTLSTEGFTQHVYPLPAPVFKADAHLGYLVPKQQLPESIWFPQTSPTSVPPGSTRTLINNFSAVATNAAPARFGIDSNGTATWPIDGTTDPDGYDISSYQAGNRFQPIVAGTYLVIARVTYGTLDDGKYGEGFLYRDDDVTARCDGDLLDWGYAYVSTTTGTASIPLFAIVELNGVDEYVEMCSKHSGVGSENTAANDALTYIKAYRLGD
jgi:hypothetical protein